MCIRDSNKEEPQHVKQKPTWKYINYYPYTSECGSTLSQVVMPRFVHACVSFPADCVVTVLIEVPGVQFK